MKKLTKLYVCEAARFIMAAGVGAMTVELANRLTKNMSAPKAVFYKICSVPFAFGIGSGIDYYINNIECGLDLRKENLILNESVIEENMGD